NVPLTWNEALSGIFGSISLASWIFLLIPQLIENYRLGSADGISLTFLLIWFLGDIANLLGALWAGLVPTVIALAIYFCFADVTLIAQCLYYGRVKKRRLAAARQDVSSSEHTPLLNGHARPKTSDSTSGRLTDVTDANLGLPGSRRRSSAASRRMTLESAIAGSRESLADIEEGRDDLETPIVPQREWLKNTFAILAILLVGAAGWAIAWRLGVWKPTPAPSSGHHKDHTKQGTPIGASLLGYASAVLYLGARIPQIVKNQRERSCEGLSLLFFLLSLVGNATYGAGILFHSVEREYFLTNLPWLIGSLGTMGEDAVIFVQFSIF
ncbi:PQ loop repeat family protein, partial [Dissoconium aciculare CBS 342.82]|uniref:PQ loop repeat family protein n=1 Tax=Dissoconium aciculare CBS 342.82 TaxID=1314786 RepID=A0A6J3MA62_9PEZI